MPAPLKRIIPEKFCQPKKWVLSTQRFIVWFWKQTATFIEKFLKMFEFIKYLEMLSQKVCQNVLFWKWSFLFMSKILLLIFIFSNCNISDVKTAKKMFNVILILTKHQFQYKSCGNLKLFFSNTNVDWLTKIFPIVNHKIATTSWIMKFEIKASFIQNCCFFTPIFFYLDPNPDRQILISQYPSLYTFFVIFICPNFASDFLSLYQQPQTISPLSTFFFIAIRVE